MRILPATILTVLCATFLPLSASFASECGDVNGDGAVAASDALMVLRNAVGGDASLVCQQQEAGAVDERLTAIEALLAHFTVDGDKLVLSGMNLQIVDGSGATDGNGEEPTGLGNLIIGYDELSQAQENNPERDEKSGSHNLVIGARHSYTSFGGIVAGDGNSISAPGASVLGGTGNDATGSNSVVVAGDDNESAGERSAILGGSINTASALDSAIAGGTFNRAFGEDSSVTGGLSNDAQGFASTVSGGEHNRAFGPRSSISGGSDNVADGVASSVTGGDLNRANGFAVVVSGGQDVSASGHCTWAAGTLSEGD